MALPQHLKTGLRGEQLTARKLIKDGYTVLDANFSTAVGETDIIAQSKDGVLCFVEVKTRAPGGMLPPLEAVDYQKQQRLISNAAAYIKNCPISFMQIRFDISEVILYDLYTYDIKITQNAFGQGSFSLTE